VRTGAAIQAAESAAVQRDAAAVLHRAAGVFSAGEPPAPVVRLRRLLTMFQVGRVHDVAAGRV